MTRADASEWMPFHGDRFFGSERVVAMEHAAKLLYLRCLWRQWTHGPIPADEALLRRMFPEFASEWSQLWPQVRPMFKEADGRLVNETNAEIRSETDAVVETRRRGAAKTNAIRWPKNGVSVAERSLSDSRATRSSARSSDAPATRERSLVTVTGIETETSINPPDPPSGGTGASAPPHSDGPKRRKRAPGDPKPPGGTPATRAWDAAFRRVRSAEYGWSPSDFPAIATVSGYPGATPQEIERRATKLLRSEDPWHVKHATPRGLRDEWNRWPPPAPEPEPQAPIVVDPATEAALKAATDSLFFHNGSKP